MEKNLCFRHLLPQVFLCILVTQNTLKNQLLVEQMTIFIVPKSPSRYLIIDRKAIMARNSHQVALVMKMMNRKDNMHKES